MTVKEIIAGFHETKSFTDAAIESVQNDGDLRKALCDYFEINVDRDFALALIDHFISLRLNPNIGTAGDDLMLAAFILGKHGQVEDCLKIWEAKTTDFDALCYIDIQLMVFAGVEQTLDFLKNKEGGTADEALTYITECKDAGDFDNIDTYFDKGRDLWFV